MKKEYHGYEVVDTPVVGKLFEVNILGIDRSSFACPKKKFEEERIRSIIQKAFVEVDKHSEKYATQFYTLIPKKEWIGDKTVVELKVYANDLGGQMADWVEQALQWAQRISNGESWEDICHKADTTYWYHKIITWNGYYRAIGGFGVHPTYTGHRDYYSFEKINDAVPLVVIKKK